MHPFYALQSVSAFLAQDNRPGKKVFPPRRSRRNRAKNWEHQRSFSLSPPPTFSAAYNIFAQSPWQRRWFAHRVENAALGRAAGASPAAMVSWGCLEGRQPCQERLSAVAQGALERLLKPPWLSTFRSSPGSWRLAALP